MILFIINLGYKDPQVERNRNGFFNVYNLQKKLEKSETETTVTHTDSPDQIKDFVNQKEYENIPQGNGKYDQEGKTP